jgi:hypothetical protein
MMPFQKLAFRCWLPDEEDEDAGYLCRALHAEYAATDFAEHMHSESAGELGLEFPVSVRCEDGTLTQWRVTGDYSVTFGAAQIPADEKPTE